MSESNDVKRQDDLRAVTVKPRNQVVYNVNRLVVDQDTVIGKSNYTAPDTSLGYAMRECYHKCSFIRVLFSIMPILQWLPKYSIKRNLMGDIVSGITVGIVHIPHGIAYGILAGLPPSNGLYMAIFPCLVYMLFGTSRHMSIGTWAVSSLMILKIVNDNPEHTPVEIVASVTFIVGLLLVAMCMLRLGIISSLFSEPFVSGFTTGAACHVIVSQLKEVLGVTVKRRKAAFRIIMTLYDICRKIPQTNVPTLIFSVAVFAFMVLCNELIKPALKKVCYIPLPGELIAVMGSTLISKYVDVKGRWNISIIGPIPQGLPVPVVPNYEIMPKVFVDSIGIAIVSYSVVVSMSFFFSRKHNYNIHPNQELFAMGIGNIISSFFLCMPLACSMSRSLILEQSGGSSLLTTIPSVIIIITVLYIGGPFFYYLPTCALSAIIIVALKQMFVQTKRVKKFLKDGSLTFLQWFITCFTVVLIGVEYGILTGLGMSVVTLFFHGFRPYASLLGFIPGMPAVYVDIKNHNNAVEVPDTKIFRYYSSFNFATALTLRKTLYETIEYTPNSRNSFERPFHFLIIDLSMIGYFDSSGTEVLSSIKQELGKCGVRVLLCSPSDRVYDRLINNTAAEQGAYEVFPSLHDAVEYAKACRLAIFPAP